MRGTLEWHAFCPGEHLRWTERRESRRRLRTDRQADREVGAQLTGIWSTEAQALGVLAGCHMGWEQVNIAHNKQLSLLRTSGRVQTRSSATVLRHWGVATRGDSHQEQTPTEMHACPPEDAANHWVAWKAPLVSLPASPDTDQLTGTKGTVNDGPMCFAASNGLSHHNSSLDSRRCLFLFAGCRETLRGFVCKSIGVECEHMRDTGQTNITWKYLLEGAPGAARQCCCETCQTTARSRLYQTKP